MKRFLSTVLASAAIALASVPAEATLTTIGTASYGAGDYNLIHDNDLGLIWLDYSNALNNWENQMAWSSSLNGAGVLTYNINPELAITWKGDWRLPDANPSTPYYTYGNDGSTSAGYNITSSEMGHLYYTELGNIGYYTTGGIPQSGWGLQNTIPFANLHPFHYWSGTEYDPDNTMAWSTGFYYGPQDNTDKYFVFYALAVCPGIVTAASVPEPGTMMLMGSGLVGLVGMRRRFKA